MTPETFCIDCGDPTTCWDTNLENHCDSCAKKLRRTWLNLDRAFFESDIDIREAYQQ